MNYVHMVWYKGKLVDIKTLPEEEQEKIKKELSKRMADNIATQLSRRD